MIALRQLFKRLVPTVNPQEQKKPDRIDFTTKRLGLTHAPQVTTTLPPGKKAPTWNDKGQAILSLRQEITNKFYNYDRR